MSRAEDAIPPTQIFRTLLLHFLETQKLLTPIAATTLSKELKWCHQQNVYILSEIGSWLVDLTEGTDLTPSFSPAQAAELLDGVASSLRTPASPPLAGAPTTIPAKPVLPDLPPGLRRAASSRRRERTPVAWARSSTGQIFFPQRSSSERPDSTLPTPSSDMDSASPDYGTTPDSNAPPEPLGD